MSDTPFSRDRSLGPWCVWCLCRPHVSAPVRDDYSCGRIRCVGHFDAQTGYFRPHWGQ